MKAWGTLGALLVLSSVGACDPGSEDQTPTATSLTTSPSAEGSATEGASGTGGSTSGADGQTGLSGGGSTNVAGTEGAEPYSQTLATLPRALR